LNSDIVVSTNERLKRLAYDADLKGMVVIGSSSLQLVPLKLHRFEINALYIGSQIRKSTC